MPLMEEGIYYGHLVEIGTDQLGNAAKTPYVYVAWEITHRAADEKWLPIEPVRRESRWWVTDKAEPYTMDRLERLGFNGDFDAPQFDADPNPQTKGVQLVCRHDIRDGKAYENWDLAGSGQERERAPWPTDFKRVFKAKYRTRLSSRKAPEGRPAAPPATPAAAKPADNSPVRDDEVPAEASVQDVPDSEIPF